VSRDVVLVPGLWMPGLAMTILAGRLARRGYTVRVFAYWGRTPLEANVERLARFSKDALNGKRVHFIGHSLGGVLILETLNRHPEVPAASAVLLGAPVRGCYAGRRLGLARVGRWMMGACGPQWEERAAAWKRAEPIGVVAGTLALGLGRVLGPLPGPNDGVVRVAETGLEGMTAQALVRQGHSSLIVSTQVVDLIDRFIVQRRFE
jgi:pimeloyl-ACP methyl ester carboxylesterase